MGGGSAREVAHFREDRKLELVRLRASKTKRQLGKTATSATRDSSAADEQAQSELNVIGRTTDEAVDAVDKFLDEASSRA
jgi:dsDNA-specific endonuclease/ATPase MutS2